MQKSVFPRSVLLNLAFSLLSSHFAFVSFLCSCHEKGRFCAREGLTKVFKEGISIILKGGTQECVFHLILGIKHEGQNSVGVTTPPRGKNLLTPYFHQMQWLPWSSELLGMFSWTADSLLVALGLLFQMTVIAWVLLLQAANSGRWLALGDARFLPFCRRALISSPGVVPLILVLAM